MKVSWKNLLIMVKIYQKQGYAAFFQRKDL